MSERTERSETTRGWQNNPWPPGPDAAAVACLLSIQEERRNGLQCSYDVHRGGCEIMCVCVWTPEPSRSGWTIWTPPPLSSLPPSMCRPAASRTRLGPVCKLRMSVGGLLLFIDMIKCMSGRVTDYMLWYSRLVIRLVLQGDKVPEWLVFSRDSSSLLRRTVLPQVNTTFVLFFLASHQLYQSETKCRVFFCQIAKCTAKSSPVFTSLC